MFYDVSESRFILACAILFSLATRASVIKLSITNKCYIIAYAPHGSTNVALDTKLFLQPVLQKPWI